MDTDTKRAARVDRVVPETVRKVCRVLREAGFEAYAVGGAVRDAILGRRPGDWDVTTSAHPDEVTELFNKTIPTGIEHGTVTVVVGRGETGAIEVTTFRGEGAYSDARRPDHVVFGVPLREDLARRDFVINAIAFDPIDGRFADPFGGVEDIERRVIRAVGQASERFTEDGLRIMRAVRFVAVLDFELDAETEAAIAGALPSLAKVAAERVRVELFKLLGGVAALRALGIAHGAGVLDVVLPELSDELRGAAMTRACALDPDPALRAGGLLAGLSAADAERAARRLTFSNDERARAVAMASALSQAPALVGSGDTALRAAMGDIGRKFVTDAARVWAAEGDAKLTALAQRARTILLAGDPLVVGDLAVGGADVIDELAIKPGRIVGEILTELLRAAHADPAINEPATLRRRMHAILRDRTE